MDKIAEKSLGDFLTDFVRAVAFGFLYVYLVNPIADTSSPGVSSPFSSDGFGQYLGVLVGLLMAYILGEVFGISGVAVFDLILSKKAKFHDIDEALRSIARAGVETPHYLTLAMRRNTRREWLLGVSGTTAAAIFTLAIRIIFDPASRNESAYTSLELSIIFFFISILSAVFLTLQILKMNLNLLLQKSMS